MSHVIQATDVTSPEIRKKINDDYLTLADDYYSELLADYQIDPTEAPTTPLPKVKRILILYISRAVCRDRISLTLTQITDGATEDPWNTLYKTYDKDWRDALSRITLASLLGSEYDGGGMTGSWQRG